MTRLLLAAAATAVLAGSAPAVDFPFGLFKKKQRPEPAAPRAKQHAATLATSPDESARRQAAEELRSLDPRSNAEVFPALIGALQKDPSPAVRVAAADSVGKLKPVYQPAGMVLESVAKSDPDPKVREAAENALLQYHLGGYVTPAGPRANGSAEPPIATARPTAFGGLTFRPITNTPPGKGVFYPPTAEPPLTKKLTPPPAAKPTPTKPVSTPPTPPAGVPQAMPSVLPPPAPAPLPTLPPPATTPPATTPGVPTGPLPPIIVPPPPG